MTEAHARNTNEDTALQCRFAHERRLLQSLSKVATCRGILWRVASRKTIQMAYSGRCVGSEECACLRACEIGPRWQRATEMLTVKVSHPLSARLALASCRVLVSTAFNCESLGAGRGWGLRRASSCFTAGGRCFTITGSIVGVVSNEGSLVAEAVAYIERTYLAQQRSRRNRSALRYLTLVSLRIRPPK